MRFYFRLYNYEAHDSNKDYNIKAHIKASVCHIRMCVGIKRLRVRIFVVRRLLYRTYEAFFKTSQHQLTPVMSVLEPRFVSQQALLKLSF